MKLNMVRIRGAGIALAVSISFFTGVCSSAWAEITKPNIILCMADDQGWGDVGYNGHPVLKTPNLDDMAVSGLRFDRFYAAAPVCSPTRASVLTGRNPTRTGVLTWGYDIYPQEITIAEALKTAGYTTAHFGKWHVGPVLAGSPINPGACGFDEWISSPNYYDNDAVLSNQGVPVQLKGESSIVTAELAIDFMRRQSKSGQPFLAVVWFGSPHRPHESEDEYKQPYRNNPKKAEFYGEMAALDDAVGMLRSELEKLGIKDNTLFWYCSDNGGLFHESCGGRANKGSLYEGGVRVPAIIEWPQKIKTPRVSSMVSVTSDIYPTLLDIAGITMPDQPVLDGISLRLLIEGREMASRSKPLGFWVRERKGHFLDKKLLAKMLAAQQDGKEFSVDEKVYRYDAAELRSYFPEDRLRGEAAWLDWPWKLYRVNAPKFSVLLPKGEKLGVELYNLEQDPMERNNVADAYPQRVEQMHAELKDWMRSVYSSMDGCDYK